MNNATPKANARPSHPLLSSPVPKASCINGIIVKIKMIQNEEKMAPRIRKFLPFPKNGLTDQNVCGTVRVRTDSNLFFVFTFANYYLRKIEKNCHWKAKNVILDYFLWKLKWNFKKRRKNNFAREHLHDAERPEIHRLRLLQNSTSISFLRRPHGLSRDVLGCFVFENEIADRVARPRQEHKEGRVSTDKLDHADDEICHNHESEIYETVFLEAARGLGHNGLFGFFENERQGGDHIGATRDQNHQETGKSGRDTKTNLLTNSKSKWITMPRISVNCLGWKSDVKIKLDFALS